MGEPADAGELIEQRVVAADVKLGRNHWLISWTAADIRVEVLEVHVDVATHSVANVEITKRVRGIPGSCAHVGRTCETDLTAGEVKFRTDATWQLNWGGDEDSGPSSLSFMGPNVPVEAGRYRVRMDIRAGRVAFEAL